MRFSTLSLKKKTKIESKYQTISNIIPQTESQPEIQSNHN